MTIFDHGSETGPYPNDHRKDDNGGVKTFTEEQLAAYRRDGYLAFPGFFSPEETAEIRAELDRLVEVGLLRNVATEGDGKTESKAKRNLQLCPASPHSPLYKALPYADKVRRAISELIGGDIAVRLDQIFLKPAGDGAGTNWHQDNAYFRVTNPDHGTAMWIAVHDAHAANGTMRVVPGHQHEKLEHGRDPDSNHHVRCWPDESKAVTCELPAGGVLFFAYGTPHATGANRTEADRAGLAYHFVRTDAEVGDGESVAGLPRFADGGASVYGEDLRDRFPTA